MLAPKKGLLCNLNHIHLQHISLGLHLSRHPELQETSGSMGGGEQTSCSDCPENCEQVDANSNNPSLKCQCCESHTQQLVTLGLQNQAAQEDFSCLHDGEKVASPCDPPCDLASSTSSSSSVSSCSDFSLDDSPVSVYCKGFSREESQSPENQPNISPAEDTHDGKLLADQGRTCDGRDANLNPPVPQRPDTVAGESPDSLCSGHSLDSQSDEPPPSMAAQETTSICADLDPNCNPLPDGDTEPPAPPVPGRWDPGLSRAPEPRPRAGSLPPPVPPRPRRRLQVLSGHRAEQLPLPARTAELELGSGDLCRDVGKKTITSFHELAQKRKRNAAGPALAQARADRSDWLIVFSPDTELPPPSELLSGTTGQEPARPQLQPDWPPRPPGSRQREVTTFKELRYRSASSKPKGQPAGERAEPAAAQHPSAALEAAVGSEGSGWVPPAPLGGQLLAPADSHQLKRRRPRPGLQPIAEGQPGDAEEGGLPPRSCFPGEKGLGSGRGEDAPGRRLGGAGGDLWVPGTVERRDEACKEALLIAVSAAVDKIIAHFSAARNLVQKAQLGDSRLSPDVGYLLLHTLCPALYALVEDGLKPFQKDVITGQRKNSPWSVVEASVKTGPNTRSLHSLCWHVAGLAPLSSTRQKFHAFILGLLNIKQLELWISQLQKSPGVISVLYSPTAFFALSQGPFPHLADELLLLIQPLSVLTFHLDLLFEHHHLSMDVRPLSRRLESPLSPARHSAQAQGAVQPARGGQSGAGGTSLEEEMPPDALGRAASAEGSTRSQAQAAARGLVPAPQVGVALQQTLQHVLRWGDQLSRAFLGADGSPETPRSEAGPRDAGAGLSGWWGQLSQASRIYAAPSKEKVPFIWWTKLRTAAGESSPGLAARSQTSMNEPRGTELQLLQTKGVPELPSPKATSSADTSGTSSPEDLVLSAGAGAPTNDPIAGEKLLPVSPEPRANGDRAAPSDPEAGGPPGPDKGSWLGRLFGATSPSARSFPPNPDTTSAKSRRPSSWLSPSARVLAAVVKGLASEKTRVPEPERNVSASPQSHRAVRALCDHLGTADGHLSFQKGDILQLLSTVDEDWIRCCHGNSTGLVPVGYTSLIL
ncbi:AP-4 complex accessory subunit RUSC1 isoform X2 [Athene noctua]|uniref:AP-4 complex accessory subunit RUSC1 isoform X2 n=1 Tax=Athene noctua TaxID=126797 RepID=UPI003EBEF2F2